MKIRGILVLLPVKLQVLAEGHAFPQPILVMAGHRPGMVRLKTCLQEPTTFMVKNGLYNLC